MHPNGVSHLEVCNDQEGVEKILQWLSFVPKTADAPPRARPVTDPVLREVTANASYYSEKPSTNCR